MDSEISLLKKKKSSLIKTNKMPFLADAAEPEKDAVDDITDILENNLVLQNFGKKKKKKKLTYNLNDFENVATTMPDKNETSVDNEETTDNVDISLDIDFSMSKKKRKHKKKELVDLLLDKVDEEPNFEDNAYEQQQQQQQQQHQHGTDSNDQETDVDYTYDELLKRAFDIMMEKNPDIANGRRAKFVMRPPQVIRIGTKKTSFANFMDIAKTLHRVPKHLLDFLLAELGTSGSMDGNKQLIIKGRFHAKQIENVLRRYIKEYVTCHTCRSPDTLLQKETRLFFLKCETCGSRCSVASIKSGFQAVTGKRAAIRAKTT